MRRAYGRAGLLIVLGATVGLPAVAGCQASHPSSAVIELDARAPERGNWSPRTIQVERGKEVTLVIRNVDVVTHGFYLPILGVGITHIKAGDIKELSFVPDVEGEFPFYCTVWCSDYHMQMRGTLIVR